MGRASRAKRERKERGQIFSKTGAGTQTIELRNPVKQHFGSFVVGNADGWRVQYLNQWEKDGARLHEYRWWRMEDERLKYVEKHEALAAIHLPVVRVASQRLKRDPGVVREGSAKGKELVICGAGPSLSDNARDYIPPRNIFARALRWGEGVLRRTLPEKYRKHIQPERDVWGCNSALPWLYDKGYNVTHGFTVDQTPTMLKEWKDAPDVEYLCASSIHPHLSDLLTKRGRTITWFHNYCGFTGVSNDGKPVTTVTIDGETQSYEDWVYSLYYPATIRCGSGLNAVNRALDLAQFMGYDRVYVLGADCHIRTLKPAPKVPAGHPEHLKWLDEATVFHADGGSAVVNGQSSLTMEGEIDGRTYLTKPDLAVSATWLELQRRASGGTVEVIGDTLSNALRDKDEAYLRRMPSVTNADGNLVIPIDGPGGEETAA